MPGSPSPWAGLGGLPTHASLLSISADLPYFPPTPRLCTRSAVGRNTEGWRPWAHPWRLRDAWEDPARLGSDGSSSVWGRTMLSVGNCSDPGLTGWPPRGGLGCCFPRYNLEGTWGRHRSGITSRRACWGGGQPGVLRADSLGLESPGWGRKGGWNPERSGKGRFAVCMSGTVRERHA